MTPWLVTAPTVEPIDLADAKRQCHLSDDLTDQDAQISAYISAAREWAEVYTGRALLTQTWDLKFDAFPDVICLPKPPIASVTSVSYIDTNGTTQTLSSSLYTTDLPTGPYAPPGRIVPVYGSTWPSTRDVPNAVTVRVVCGYGSDPALVPDAIKQAIRVKVATMFGAREGLVVGTIASPIPSADDLLLWPFKVWPC